MRTDYFHHSTSKCHLTSCRSRHTSFLAWNANENPSSETNRPLATSSLTRPLSGLTYSTLKFMRSTCGKSTTSYIITFDQYWQHLYSSPGGGKAFSSNTHIRTVLSLTVPEICKKMLKKLSEKLPATTLGYSMVKFATSMTHSWSISTAKKPIRRSITAAKEKEMP